MIDGLTGGPVDCVNTCAAGRAEERLRVVVELDLHLSASYGDEAHVRAWLRAPNRNLDDRKPIEMMATSPEWMRWSIRSMRLAS
jgi:hypothetical protein